MMTSEIRKDELTRKIPTQNFWWEHLLENGHLGKGDGMTTLRRILEDKVTRMRSEWNCHVTRGSHNWYISGHSTLLLPIVMLVINVDPKRMDRSWQI
jgi:hypothetical protein